MGVLISVIIPVYNVQEYLKECLESIINQTYKNLEIVLVDDGSTDSSGEICDKYAQKDNRIKVIHKTNGGLSDARNTGLSACTGEYISFVDSDDTIEKDMLEILYRNAVEQNADISMCKCNILVGKEKKRYKNTGKITKYLGKEKIINYLFLLTGPSIAVWLKLYKRNGRNFKFPIGKTTEDAFVILNLVKENSRLVVQESGLYNYRIRSGSITHQVKYKRAILDSVDAYKYNLERIENELPECIVAAKRRVAWAQSCAMWQLLLTDNFRSHYRKIRYLQKCMRLEICWLLTSNISAKDKIMFVLVAVSPMLYKQVRMIAECYRR